jgi:hypothetical protein
MDQLKDGKAIDPARCIAALYNEISALDIPALT